MKQYNKLFAILFAVLGVTTSAMAQTDVTDTYLTNAGFETDGHQTGTIVPTGWTLGTTSGGYTSYRPISDASTPNGALPISDGVTDGASEGDCYLYMRTNWGASVCELTQTTQTLPAGKYELMVDVALPQTQTSRLRTLTIKVTGSTSGTTNSVECCYNPSIWTTVSVPFEVSSEESVVISLYHNDTSGGCSDGVLTAVDNVRLLSYDYAAMTTALTEAESLYDSSKEGAADLNAAMTTAKSLTESSDKSSIASAAKNLIEALDTYKQSLFVTPSSTDYTSWITNASLNTTTGGTVFSSKSTIWNSNVPSAWSLSRASNGGMNATTYGSGQSGNAFEIWASDASTVIGTFFQSISGLPAGKYTLKGYLQNSGKLFVINGEQATEFSSSPSTTGSWQQFDITFVKRSASDNLIVGAQTTAAQHFIVDEFSLTCVGLDLVQLTTQRDGLVDNLEALQSKLPSSYYTNTVSPAISTANEATTEETLSSAINDLSEILAEANTLLAPYANLDALITLCTEYTDPQNSNANSETILSDFQSAIETATTAKDAATSVDELTDAYNTLETARQTYAQNAVPVYPYPFDMTFLLTNTTFDSSIDGWTATGGAGRMSAGNIECYNNVFTFAYTETLTGLGNGSWEVSVDGFYRYGGYNDAETAHNGGTEQLYAKLYANTDEVALKSIMEGANEAGAVGKTTTNGVRVPDSPADGNSYFPTGCYSNTVATLITDGNLTFGLKKESTQSSDWTLFDNFTLVYKGIDVTELQTALTEWIDKADAIKSEKMGATESTALTTALSNANAESTNADDLASMTTALQSAYDAAVASIADYANIATYIAKANGIDESIAASYQTQYDNGNIEGTAEEVFQALEVATYEYVTETFPYDVALSDTWNSTGTNTEAATFSTEHWSGETREYKNQLDVWSDPKQGYPADSWSIDFDQEVTLPAGDYVFKVAGRKSVDATLELVVTKGEETLGTVNDFPSSNNALGINKEGAASFDADDEAGFANGGNGFGWQWRYVKFTLTEESTVKVAVHAETSKIYNWVSFGDYTLQMTEGTYLEANQDGLNAALEPAQALVGTLPMGEAENTALQTAIDMPVTTGAEMLAKIEALEVAVANANTWRTTYYAEKDKLVAALERFEADYNDAENGALDYMCTSRWTTVITEAGEAAVAKDNQTDHTVITAATAELVAALDAATVSVEEYAALDAAIKEATALAAANVGDQPFERPQTEADRLVTTDAQAVYDAAEADGEGVTSYTTALTEAIETFKAVPLNVPAEGARYNLVLNGNGNWEHDGKAATYLANDRTDHGLYNIQYYAATNENYAQAFTLTAVEDQQDCYTLSMTDVDGNERYICTGVSYGGNTSQIRTTITAENALVVKVIATTTDGVHNLYNTEADNYIGSQDAGVYTVNSHINFNLVAAEKADVTLTISAAEWATLILPFNAELPDGVKAYSCEKADGENLTLTEAESLVANTPYLVSGAEGTYTFSGYGLAKQDTYTDGLFTGTYVDYTTTANSNTYVLQNGEQGVAFYLVGENAQPKVKAYRCYMTYAAADAAPVFRLGDTTGIDNAQTDNVVVVYDLMGRKVTTMEKGNVYIVNGKKVVVK